MKYENWDLGRGQHRYVSIMSKGNVRKAQKDVAETTERVNDKLGRIIRDTLCIHTYSLWQPTIPYKLTHYHPDV